jgi:peptidoglycan/xylan/chitin deacetylase (PgdA/CDA1 family)
MDHFTDFFTSLGCMMQLFLILQRLKTKKGKGVKRYSCLWIILFFLIGLFESMYGQGRSIMPNVETNRIAVTFDDLPLNIAAYVSDTEMDSIVSRLITEIKQEHIPVVAFVNEIKLEAGGIRDSERVRILKKWLDAGVELGNHTYSHVSANTVPVSVFESEVVIGERTIRELLAAQGKTPRWFRHPFLHVGRRITARDSIENFLKQHGYIVAPVTIDNGEWIFSAAFDKAYKLNDTAAVHQWGTEYIAYMHRKLKYWEGFSQKLFGRNIQHVLLIHSNRINSFYFHDLCRMIREEGYSFVSLDSALQDPAYQTPDTYTGGWGISWLDHWAMTQQKPKSFYADEPRVPQEILDYTGIESE